MKATGVISAKYNVIDIYSLPLAANVCNQLLREVERNKRWSIAHVIMNPGAKSLLHVHENMDEEYFITRGTGALFCGNQDRPILVQAGSFIHIPKSMPHQFYNIGATSLEHLVLARPPFDPTDVKILEQIKRSSLNLCQARIRELPDVVECFDGAKIISYPGGDLGLSVAFGWVINDPARVKLPHYHKKTGEWIYILEGEGIVELDGTAFSVGAGSWIRIELGCRHALRNTNDEYMVAMCICDPAFDLDMSDIHHD